MKKLSILYLLLFFFALSSCNEDFNVNVAPPQGWEQEDTPAISFSATPKEAIDLAQVEDSLVQICTLVAPSVAEDAEIRYDVIFKTDQPQLVYSYALDETGAMKKADLQRTIELLYNKRPDARTLTASISASIILGTESVYAKTDEFSLVVTPEAPLIESGYYLIGDFCGWDANQLAAFSHSGLDVYEDPYFTLQLTIEKPDQYWKIIAQSNIDAGELWNAGGVLGVAEDGSPAPSGNLTTDNPQAGRLTEPGIYKLTLNMMDYTYEIKEIVPLYYMVGAIQGWSDSNMDFMLYPQSTSVFSYTADFTGDCNFKFWMQSDFGDWGNAIGGSTDGDVALSGNLKVDGGAIRTPQTGLYTVTIDVKNMTYTQEAVVAPVTIYSNISLIGEFNGWDGENGSELDFVQYTAHNWILKQVELPTGYLKIRANHDWGISWGSPGESLNIGDINYGKGTQENGANLIVPAGTYTIHFNDITGEFAFINF